MDSPQPFVPASRDILANWRGPALNERGEDILIVDADPDCGDVISTISVGFHPVQRWGTVDAVRLDTRRREVQRLLCDRLNLAEWVRGSEWCAPLVWWAGMTGRAIPVVLQPWQPGKEPTHPEYRCDPRAAEWNTELWAHGWHIFGVASATFWGGQAHGEERGDAGKAAADLAALNHDCALLDDVDGRRVLTLPPLVAGSEPIVWSLQ